MFEWQQWSVVRCIQLYQLPLKVWRHQDRYICIHKKRLTCINDGITVNSIQHLMNGIHNNRTDENCTITKLCKCHTPVKFDAASKLFTTVNSHTNSLHAASNIHYWATDLWLPPAHRHEKLHNSIHGLLSVKCAT